MSRTWLVTGCSSGLGRATAEEVLLAGDKVVVTARRRETVEDIASGHPGRALALALDVTDPASIDTAIKAAEEWSGGIDVLVNNAAYGLYCAVEEADDDEILALFDTNVFGLVRVVRAVLPGMRSRNAGTIFNVGSVAGVVGGPGNGFYAASKFALEALSEALHAELAPQGVRVVLLEPSGIRSDFHGRSYKRAKRTIAAYSATAGKQIETYLSLDGRQPGDPHRMARVMIELARSEQPPLRIALGASSVDRIRTKLKSMLVGLDQLAEVSRSVDFDKPA
jgi:NAD(P)-dependent dehydrogenase (short-subunit alcohol dehydrogenase family)